MRRILLAAVLGVSTIAGYAGTAEAHWHHGCGPAVFVQPRVVAYAPPVYYGPPAVYAPAPVVYPTNSISFFGRNFGLRFGF